MFKIGINGSGKMAQEISLVENVVFLCNRNQSLSDLLNRDKIDVLIDFSHQSCIYNVLEQSLKHQLPLVIGTTGFNQEQEKLIEIASKTIPIFISSNMSISVNVLFNILHQIAQSLPDFEVDILDIHHKNKQDSPSGTAIKIGKIIAEAKSNVFKPISYITDMPSFNNKKLPDEIGFASQRCGNITGKHTVTFMNNDESLEITSTVYNRACYADGAVKIAGFIINKTSGLYTDLIS